MTKEPKERNIKLIIEYDGTPFLGFQAQEAGSTIQSELEKAIFHITRQHPILRAAGRTDAGVHAQGQVVNFKTPTNLSTGRLLLALNAVIHKSIAIKHVEEVSFSFDAKKDAQWKRYRYTIYQAQAESALARHKSWHIRQRLNIEDMKQASQHLIGEHDFESFRHTHCQAAHARRCLYDIRFDIQEESAYGFFLHITYQGNAFCRHMCRIFTGTLVEVGRQRITSSDIVRILEAKDRTQASMTAPAHGLCMLEVGYSALAISSAISLF